MRGKGLLFSVMLAAALSLGMKPCAAAPRPSPALTTRPALTVSIAAPLDEGSIRHIGSYNTVPHIDVIIQNVSDKPQKIWDENNSVGYDNVTLEITALDGKPLPKALIVSRYIWAWGGNVIRSLTLEPGDVALRTVNFYPYKTGDREKPPYNLGSWYNYVGFPSLGPTGDANRLLDMRAVFEIRNDADTKVRGVWSGKVMSETRDYRVLGNYPYSQPGT